MRSTSSSNKNNCYRECCLLLAITGIVQQFHFTVLPKQPLCVIQTSVLYADQSVPEPRPKSSCIIMNYIPGAN